MIKTWIKGLDHVPNSEISLKSGLMKVHTFLKRDNKYIYSISGLPQSDIENLIQNEEH